MKLIPDESNKVSVNYWCSWCAQSALLCRGNVPDRSGPGLVLKWLF